MSLPRTLPSYWLVPILALAGCGTGTSRAADEGQEVAALPGDDDILAEVDDTTISRYDLERALATTLGPLADGVDGETRHDVLESLVTSRAISMAREEELTPLERSALEREVAAHREQLLVRQYLARHAPAEPPSDEDVQAYYDAHPERFGPRSIRQYEMLLTTRGLTDEETTSVLEELGHVSEHADWEGFASQLDARGLPIAWQQGDADNAMLHVRLRQVLASLDGHRPSAITFIEGRAFVLRVTGEIETPARSLAQVREEIRETLGPRSLRDSIRAVREDAMRDVHVVYHEHHEPPAE